MAVTNLTINGWLGKLTASLESSTSVLLQAHELHIPSDGISLLDVKNELLLSYLQNLVILILSRLRNAYGVTDSFDANEAVKKLVELRLYLEKGVRPLEGRLKYQIDKVVRAANLADRQAPQERQQGKTILKSGVHQPDYTVHDKNDQSNNVASSEEHDDLAYRPNVAAFLQSKSGSKDETALANTDARGGTYRPPRVMPTAIPQQSALDKKVSVRRKVLRSDTIDDFLDAEISHAPLAEPSIGSNIISGGRYTKSQKDRREESERTAYEENNFVRLPPQSKKERAKRADRRQSGFGGDELRGLGAGLDRIDRLTSKRRRPDGRYLALMREGHDKGPKRIRRAVRG